MPPPFFAWLDSSELDRGCALEVIDLLSKQDTRAELGIGPIWDALSDIHAPWTTPYPHRTGFPCAKTHHQRRVASLDQLA